MEKETRLSDFSVGAKSNRFGAYESQIGSVSMQSKEIFTSVRCKRLRVNAGGTEFGGYCSPGSTHPARCGLNAGSGGGAKSTNYTSYRKARGGGGVATDVHRPRGSLACRVEHLRRNFETRAK